MHYLVPPDHFRKNVRAEMKTLLCYDISRDGLSGNVLLCYKIELISLFDCNPRQPRNDPTRQ